MSLLLGIILLSQNIWAQDDLTVLPDNGGENLYYEHLMKVFDGLVDLRKADLAEALTNETKQLERRDSLRVIYKELLGDFPEKTPLNPVLVDTIDRSGLGFVVEKLYFESLPNHHVTANFYVPASGNGPFPGVLIMPGHYSEGKAAQVLQSLCMLLASNDIAALIIDPIGQSERGQIINPATGKLVDTNTSGTDSQTKMDMGSVLVGRGAAGWELWDNTRALDYLYSRTDVVDTSRIAITGSSGGGAQALFLISTEYNRIEAAAITSWVTNKSHIFAVAGLFAGSHHFFDQGIHHIDQTENMLMFAPMPLIMIAASQDFIDTAGTHETAAEMVDIYNSLNVPGQISYYESPDVHGYTQPKREACTRWFKQWFYNDTSKVVDPLFRNFSSTALKVTSTGAVVYEYDNEKTVVDLNVEMADEKSSFRENFWSTNTADSCLSMVKALVKLNETDAVPTVENMGSIDRTDYSIEKMKIQRGDNVPLPTLVFRPKNISGRAPVVIFLSGNGKGYFADPGGYIEKNYLDSGKIVYAVDLRGMGETKDSDDRLGFISMYIGRTHIGQRLEDAMDLVKVLMQDQQVDTTNIILVGEERAAPVALHLAAMDERIKSVRLINTFDSWMGIVSNAFQTDVSSYVVPRALQFYDFSNLVDAISPRQASFGKSIDSKLFKIIVTGGKLGEDFQPSIYNYELTDLTKSEVKVSVLLNDDKSTVSGEGTYDVSSGPVTAEIVCTAEDGITKSVYTVEIPQFVSVGNVTVMPGGIDRAYPNPFTGATNIVYHIETPGDVELGLYDLNGRLVLSVYDEYQQPGSYNIELNTEELEAGVYFCRLRVGEMNDFVKLVKAR